MKDHFWTIVSATAEITLAVVVLTDLAWKIYVHRAPTEQDKFKKLRRGLGLSGVLLLSILAVLYMVSGLSPVALDSEGALVVGRPCLSVPKFRCYERIYSYTVSPVGWERTPIEVKVGQRLTFRAEGMVTIALTELMETVVMRRQIENRRAAKHLDPDSFTVDEEKLIQPEEGLDWTGPNGSGRGVSVIKPGREMTRPLPSEPYGALIGAVSAKRGTDWPDSSEVFLVGDGRGLGEYVAPRDGKLWFNVNDVGYYRARGPRWPRFWNRDNVGFFHVILSVRD